MLYAIGKEGEIVRAFIRTSPEDAIAQAQTGEIVLEVQSAVPARIEDGKLVAVEASTKEKWAEIKHTRAALLANSDWTQLADVPESTKRKWQGYRQALRDITEQDAYKIAWPQPPQ